MYGFFKSVAVVLVDAKDQIDAIASKTLVSVYLFDDHISL